MAIAPSPSGLLRALTGGNWTAEAVLKQLAVVV